MDANGCNYDKVDPVIIVGILKKNLSDFEAFKKAVRRLLSRRLGGKPPCMRLPGNMRIVLDLVFGSTSAGACG